MKILVTIPYFYPKIGGLENYALAILRGLNERYKIDVVVITSNHINNKYEEDNLGRIKIYRLPTWFKLSNTPINILWFFYVQKIINKEKPDLINGHTPVPFMADLGGFLAKVNKIPFVLTYQNDLFKNSNLINNILKFYYKTVGNFIFKNSKKIICSSAYYANNSPYLKKYLNKISIVPPGVYKDRFEKIRNIKFSISSGYILFVGQLDKTHSHKGLDYLLSAICILKKRNTILKLVIVGKGNNKNYFEGLATKLNINKDIVFAENVTDKMLPLYYKNASLVVLPTINNSEGFGIVLIEAGISKKPVIATKVGGIPFVVDNNKTGILVPPKNSEALATAIEKLIKNSKLAKKLGEEGYKKVIENFTWDKQVEKTYKLISTLL